MPVSALAPPAWCPLLAPFLVRLGARSLWVRRSVATLVATHSKRMRSIWVCFEFAPDVARFR
eukprot:1420228-Pleurochrysis_carterae.AAC.1